MLGSRSLADVIAPDSVEIASDHLRLDGVYARALAVTAYPRLVTPGWLSLLTESDMPIELSLHALGESLMARRRRAPRHRGAAGMIAHRLPNCPLLCRL